MTLMPSQWSHGFASLPDVMFSGHVTAGRRQDQGRPAYGRMRERAEGQFSFQTYLSLSPRDAPELCQELPPGGRGATLKRERGRGECRVPDAPAASCAHSSEKCARVFTARSPESPGIPARNGFTAYFVLSPAIGFFATVASRIKVLSDPVEPNAPPQDLTPASRRQDHTTSPSASAPSSCVPEIAHGEQSALRPHRTPDAAASTASHPASVTIAIRPSCGTRRLWIGR